MAVINPISQGYSIGKIGPALKRKVHKIILTCGADACLSEASSGAENVKIISCTLLYTCLITLTLLTTALLTTAWVQAAVLPEERADLFYHSYEGDGLEINGPAVLVRKHMSNQVSVSGHYLVDNVSGASVDVRLFASPYREKRTEQSIGLELLDKKTLYSAGYGTSNENDYDASTAFLSISQDFFGDLTNLTLSYSRGADVVGNSTNPDFAEDVERENYKLSLTQILTPRALMTAAIETISDEGFLNNPYRSVRFLDTSVPRGWSAQPEVYPSTRTSNSVGFGARYYLDYEASIEGNYRYFSDTWEIDAHTFQLKYSQRVKAYTFITKFRYHTQTQAAFYSDLFPFRDAQNFLARDKEMDGLTSILFGVAIRYTLDTKDISWLKKIESNLAIDRYSIEYDNFRDANISAATPGAEPLFTLDANIIRFYLTARY